MTCTDTETHGFDICTCSCHCTTLKNIKSLMDVMCESCVVIKKKQKKKPGIFCKRPDKAEKGLMIEKTVIFSLLLSEIK